MSMRKRFILETAVVALMAAPLAAQTVTLSLASPENGDTVTPGATIHWSIGFAVSSDNAGLALLVVDLAQGASNPATIDIPPADGVPLALTSFSRPAGISNPGETNPATGYIGVQRGETGEKNLRQIGGAQNTFGEALPPGSGVAESAVVTRSIGQDGLATLAGGSFTAPSTPGTYTFQLENALANVLTVVNSPPQHSQVQRATISLSNAAIVFSVSETPCESCDANCDGETDGLDIQPFVDALISSPTGCSSCAGDLDGSGDVTLADIGLFVACQLGA